MNEMTLPACASKREQFFSLIQTTGTNIHYIE